MPRAYSIGVTLAGGGVDLANAVWSSGIGQNAALLLMLLQRLPVCAAAVAVETSRGPIAQFAGVPSIPPHEAAEKLDIIIEVGMRYGGELMAPFQTRGGRLVSYMAGNTLAMNKEALSSELPHGEAMPELTYDATWILPHHWRMNRAYCRITRSPRVAQVPYIWEPIFLETWAREHGNRIFHTPGRTAWRLGVLEPNVNVLKTFHLPMMACEQAFRTHPHLIERVLLFNTQHLIGTPHFDDITMSTDLARAGRMTAEPRLPIATLLAQHIDAVVAHQWENALNNLYFDVLWSGRPLIHNSDMLEGAGYRYEPFDPEDGGRVIADALGRHDTQARAYREAAVAFARRHSIDEPAIQAAHTALVEELFA